MCTVTIVPVSGGIRMVCNRDESLLRTPALPPRVLAFGLRRAVMPIDPLSGGTWIAGSDSGVIATLLNFYADPHDRKAPPAKKSRGTIIPALMDAANLAEAFARTEQFAADDFADFRLVLADQESVAEVLLNRGAWMRQPPRPIDGPLLFTSSGLGQAVVEPPRRELFEAFFANAGDRAARQDEYQRHVWPDKPHVSVCMRRPDARTVSYTVIELGDAGVRMSYQPVAEDGRFAAAVNTSINLT